MKMSGGSGEILRAVFPFVSPRLFSAAILFEFMLGVWLLVGLSRHWSWLISNLFFVFLACVSFQLGWIGQASCGCFGKVIVSPWWAFAIDVLAIGVLWIFPPGDLLGGLKSGLPTALGALAIFLATGSGMVLRFGSIEAALSHLRREPIVVSPEVVDLRKGQINESRTFSISISNYTSSSIRVLGGTSDCKCIATDDLPVEVPAGGKRAIQVHLKFGTAPGRFRGKFVLYVDNGRFTVMPVFVTGVTDG